MADDVEMTPIAPEEGGAVPPKVAPFGAPAAPAAPVAAAASAAAPAAPAPTTSTIKLKPVIRKPMIHKPTIGAKPPVVPQPTAASAAVKKATQNLKSVTGPIPAQATLKKTGIIAEGIITPQQQQAAKSKTSRISLESAMGVAPVAKTGPAPLRTIKLKRPTDLKPSGPTPLTSAKPAAPATPEPLAAENPAAPKLEPIAPAEGTAEDASVTQKKTLKLHRPGAVGIKRPSLSLGGAVPAAEGGEPATMPTVGGDVPEMATIAPLDLGAGVPAAEESAGVPSWVAVLSLITTLAALVVIGVALYYLWMEGAGPVAGANEMQFLQM